MSIWQLTNDDVEAIMTQLRAGRSAEQVAESFGISLEMVACAVRKWPAIRHYSLLPSL